VIVEAKSRNSPRRQAVGEMAERAVRARVLVPDRRADDGHAVARRRGLIGVKPSETRVIAISDVEGLSLHFLRYSAATAARSGLRLATYHSSARSSPSWTRTVGLKPSRLVAFEMSAREKRTSPGRKSR